MDDHTTAKLNAFRSLAQQAGALHSELATLDDAVRDLDAIKARISDCRDEAEARQIVADLKRAEETVTVKRLRESRLRDELATKVKEAELTYFDVMTGIDAALNDLAWAAIQPFRDLLQSLQPEEDNPKRDDANKVALAALAPAVHVEDLTKLLRDAWRAIGVVTGDPYGPAKGIATALEITESLLSRIPEVHNERKRHAGACEAFRKALAKG